MGDKTKAATEQEALDEVEVKANSNYQTRNLHLVDGSPEECSDLQATFYGVYIRHKQGGPAMWVADVATKDDADFICKSLQIRNV